MLIATTLAPRRVEEQLAAVRSWRSLGFGVISLNAPEERAKVACDFSYVMVASAPRVEALGEGRAVPHVRDAVNVLFSSGATTMGLVNSDVELGATETFPRDLPSWCEDGLLFGARADVETIGGRDGPMLPHGFDYFFFGRKAAEGFEDLGFCFGQPWWDYWMPFSALARGLPVRRLARPVGYHVRHAMAWDWVQWQTYGRRYMRHLRGLEDVDPRATEVVDLAKRRPWAMQEVAQAIVRALYRCPVVDPGLPL